MLDKFSAVLTPQARDADDKQDVRFGTDHIMVEYIESIEAPQLTTISSSPTLTFDNADATSSVLPSTDTVDSATVASNPVTSSASATLAETPTASAQATVSTEPLPSTESAVTVSSTGLTMEPSGLAAVSSRTLQPLQTPLAITQLPSISIYTTTSVVDSPMPTVMSESVSKAIVSISSTVTLTVSVKATSSTPAALAGTSSVLSTYSAQATHSHATSTIRPHATSSVSASAAPSPTTPTASPNTLVNNDALNASRVRAVFIGIGVVVGIIVLFLLFRKCILRKCCGAEPEEKRADEEDIWVNPAKTASHNVYGSTSHMGLPAAVQQHRETLQATSGSPFAQASKTPHRTPHRTPQPWTAPLPSQLQQELTPIPARRVSVRRISPSDPTTWAPPNHPPPPPPPLPPQLTAMYQPPPRPDSSKPYSPAAVMDWSSPRRY